MSYITLACRRSQIFSDDLSRKYIIYLITDHLVLGWHNNTRSIITRDSDIQTIEWINATNVYEGAVFTGAEQELKLHFCRGNLWWIINCNTGEQNYTFFLMTNVSPLLLLDSGSLILNLRLYLLLHVRFQSNVIVYNSKNCKEIEHAFQRDS